MSSTAEGVEDEQSLVVLAQAGCHFAQGYHIGRPMPGQQLMEWLSNYHQQHQAGQL